MLPTTDRSWEQHLLSRRRETLSTALPSMELWVDSKKIGQNLEDQLKKTATIVPGKHVAMFFTVDSFARHVSQSVTFYVH